MERIMRILAWSTVINYGILLIWFAVFVLGHDTLRDLHTRWFRLAPDQFDFAHYLGMAIYKIAVMVFNLVPYLAMRIVEAKAAE